MKKNVAILIFDDVDVLDFAGPFDVFALADELCNHEPFHTFMVATDSRQRAGTHGLKVVPDFTLENCSVAACARRLRRQRHPPAAQKSPPSSNGFAGRLAVPNW